jgi:hypothetical protein
LSSLIPEYVAISLPAVRSAPVYQSTLIQAIELCRERGADSDQLPPPR